MAPNKFVPLPISPCQEWRWTILEREVPCNQWEGSTCTHDGPYYFLFEDEGGEGSLNFFSIVPNVFPNMFLIKFSKCSQMRSLEVRQVPKLFPMVFPKALQFYLIYKFTMSVTELGSVTYSWSGPARHSQNFLFLEFSFKRSLIFESEFPIPEVFF